MKTKGYFWGVLLLFLGIALLFHNYGYHYDLSLISISKFWPLILISIGIGFLGKHSAFKIVSSIISAIIAGLILLALFTNPFECHHHYHNNVYFQHSDSYESSIKKVNLRMNLNVTDLTLEDTTLSLYSIESKGNRYDINTSIDDNSKEIMNLFIDDDKEVDSEGSKGTLKLNNQPLWQITGEINASRVKLDLNKYKIEKVDINVNAASFSMKLGNLTKHQDISIDAQVSSLVLELPKDSGIRLKYTGELSNKDFAGLEKNNNDEYVSKNYNKANEKIELVLSANVSKIQIKYY